MKHLMPEHVFFSLAANIKSNEKELDGLAPLMTGPPRLGIALSTSQEAGRGGLYRIYRGLE